MGGPLLQLDDEKGLVRKKTNRRYNNGMLDAHKFQGAGNRLQDKVYKHIVLRLFLDHGLAHVPVFCLPALLCYYRWS